MSMDEKHSAYRSLEDNQSTATTNTEYNLTSTGNTKLKYATYFRLKTDQTITLRINDATNDAITIPASETPFVLDQMTINKVFISNASGSTAALKILFVGPPLVAL